MTPPLCLLLASGGSAAVILRDILLIFLAAKLLAEVAERLRQPPVVGELLAGILIGPALLGWVQPNELLSTLAELGVLFLLFRVGLELKDFDLARVGSTALLVAILGVIVPFLMGWGIMLAFGEAQVGAVFVGAAMVATSVGITARVLAGKGLLQERASKIILAAAVIDDVLGLIVLAAVSSGARGRLNWFELALTATLAVGFTFVVAKWGTRTVQRMAPAVHARLRAGGGEFNLALVLLFALSLAAVYAGVAAIIGAFLAGMALANSIGDQVHEMMSGVTELLVPFFLVGIGLHFDLSAFAGRTTIVIALVILVAAVISKFVGCAAGALSLGWTEAVRVGAGMIPRGEVGMVVAQIGLGLHVIPAATYGVVVFMSIATTMIAPPLLKVAYRGAMESHGEPREVPWVG
jgi:Kef-type K+ transport system membrane component KefB